MSQFSFDSLPAGSVLQTVQTTNNGLSSCTTVIPYDDTIPQQDTDGTEVLAASITPTSVNNKVLVRAIVQGNTALDTACALALFVDSNLNAITTSLFYTFRGCAPIPPIELLHSPNTISQVTYKVKVGTTLGGTFYLNQSFDGTDVFGGTMNSVITLQEIKG